LIEELSQEEINERI